MIFEINIYTDGSCLHTHNKTPGGWGYTIYLNQAGVESVLDERSGNVLNTTNNKMELEAIFRALSFLYARVRLETLGDLSDIPIKVYTDSSWVVNCLTNSEWKCIKNRVTLDVILRFMEIFNIEICWVKGHDSNEKNDRAHMLAEKEMRSSAENAG